MPAVVGSRDAPPGRLAVGVNASDRELRKDRAKGGNTGVWKKDALAGGASGMAFPPRNNSALDRIIPRGQCRGAGRILRPESKAVTYRVRNTFRAAGEAGPFSAKDGPRGMKPRSQAIADEKSLRRRYGRPDYFRKVVFDE